MTAEARPHAPSTTPSPTLPIVAFTFGTTEAELFDVDTVPLTTREARSVGEMLFDVDHQARQLLMDVDGDAAAGLLRGWPTMVKAAAEFWDALARCQGTPTDDRCMDRLAAHAVSIETSLASGWPGPGDADPRIAHLADTLRGADALVRRYGGDVTAHRPQARDDLHAARNRTMHGLYVTAHAVTVALHAHGRDRYRHARTAGRRIALSSVQSPYAVAPTTRWLSRFATAETTAGNYLTNRFAVAVTGEARSPITDHHRIPRALAGWDIQAHRTLTCCTSAPNIVLVARTQALIAGAGILLVDAAAHQQREDVHAAAYVPDRVKRALDAASSAWSDLASRWDDLCAQNQRHDPELVRAAAEVRAAYRELTHDAATMAGPEVIATRQGLDRVVRATLAAIEAGPELAEVLATEAGNPDLVGRARALSRRAHNDIESGLATAPATGDTVWVSPADIHAARLVPLPVPVAKTLRTASATALRATRCAASASSIHRTDSEPAMTATAQRAQPLAPPRLLACTARELEPGRRR